jgi:hypothetical protein
MGVGRAYRTVPRGEGALLRNKSIRTVKKSGNKHKDKKGSDNNDCDNDDGDCGI